MAGKLKWRFDASTFKLLGRGLITDRITAIYELVKNCYDANATIVEVEFSHAQKRGPRSRIIIRDNGVGMSLSDIRDKWLVVGTSSKRKSAFSPAPFNRRYIGEKGVGRFATDKLGEHLRIKTRRQGDDKTLSVTINWGDYEKKAIGDEQLVLFTELENEYAFLERDKTFKKGHGTELTITMLHEAWDRDMLLRLDNQLGRILPPVPDPTLDFNIFLNAPELDYPEQPVKAKPIEKLATVHAAVPYDKKRKKQGVLRFDKNTEEFDIEYVDTKEFGPVTIDLYFFDVEAQKQFKSTYKNTENYVEGFKIYRDGVICTPFAEYETVLDKRRDILGVDKRRYGAAFDKLNTREFIGIVNITKDGNPEITDATNRQDFVDNQEYRLFKEFLIDQLDEFGQYRLAKREDRKERVQNNLRRATADVKDISRTLSQIVRQRPELKMVLGPTIEKAKQVTDKVNEGVKVTQESEREYQRREALYLSLMSMQDFASELAHGIRFAIAPIKHAAEYIIEFYPNPAYEKKVLHYAHLIYKQTEKVSSLVNFMLSYAQADLQDSEFFVEEMLDSVLGGPYSLTFEREGVKTELSIRDNIQLTGKRKFLEDVISNLVSNSIKALKKEADKKIICESYAEADKLHIIFSDNGSGVDPKIADKMFEMFKTTTAEEGGAGLGLFIAKSRMTALSGTIELVPSVFAPKGASFRLSLPLKK
ncbi:sensor histidine kinase [uncultured Hymenobacter sp.]|uniref:sensor histidine kinase n=1 Tax=uncultured Hymenobacter sp. TaxID=170016 RepID=UPI0035CB4848